MTPGEFNILLKHGVKMGIEYDNYGQIIIYTGLKETDDGEIVPFEE